MKEFDELVTFAAIHILTAMFIFGTIYSIFDEWRNGDFKVNAWGTVISRSRRDPGLIAQKGTFDLEFEVSSPQKSFILKTDVEMADNNPKFNVGTRHAVRFDSRNPDKKYDIGSHYAWSMAWTYGFLSMVGITALGILWLIEFSKP